MRSPRDTTVGEEDLERWIRKFRGPLVGLIASWGAGWAVAEELAQDTFAEAWIGRGHFQGHPVDHDAVGRWLSGIAFHLHAAAFRGARRRSAQALEESERAAPMAARDDRGERLAAAFERLEAPMQEVLRMHYLEETSAREVAALLGLTPKAVEGRLYRARKALREEVEQRARASASGAGS